LDFQYLGFWLFASFVLQGVFGAKIAATRSNSPVVLAASAALFVFAPAFLLRNVHPALTAHWLILAFVVAALAGPRRHRWPLITLTALATLIQPYLWMMLVLLLAGLLADDVRRGSAQWQKGAAAIGIALATSTMLLAAVGAFSSGFQSGGGNFGRASADPLTFINSVGFSRWVRPRALAPHQGEGIAYLGLGVLILVGLAAFFALPQLVRLTAWRPVHWLRATTIPVGTIGAAFLLAIYAFSDEIFVDGKKVLDLRTLYAPLSSITDRFQSSGRAIWPLMYFVIAWGILGLLRGLRDRSRYVNAIGGALILALAGVQAADTTNLGDRYDGVRSYFFGQGSDYAIGDLDDDRWPLIRDSGYKHMSTVPTALYGCGGPSYNEGYNSGRVARLSLQAYRSGLTFNSGYFSRLRTRVAESCAQQDADAMKGLQRDTVYIYFVSVVRPPKTARCTDLDTLTVCVKGDNTDSFAASLAR
jgi:hypothetical protein